jgi:hypothetical protein
VTPTEKAWRRSTKQAIADEVRHLLLGHWRCGRCGQWTCIDPCFCTFDQWSTDEIHEYLHGRA